jgi:electron transport complex protein RnfG
MSTVAGTALRLAAIAAVVAATLAWVAHLTGPRIAANRAHAARAAFAELIGVVELPAHIALPEGDATLCDAGLPPTRILRGRAPGYASEIELAVALGADGRIRGARVTAHRETPGIGDFIDLARSPWMRKFDGLPGAADDAVWAERPRGGVDAVTGATITSRAVVDGVHAMLAAAPRGAPCRH